MVLEEKKVKLPKTDFPALWQAVLYRNYGFVAKERLAEVLGTDVKTVEAEAERLELGNIVYNYLHQDEDEYRIMDDVWTLDQYIPLIDMYMQTNYREGIEKSLSHFMSGSIRRNLKAKLIE